MQEMRVRVGSRLGLHARTAVIFVRRSREFRSRVVIKRPAMEEFADGRSILGVLLLGALKGEELVLRADGVDAAEALAALCEIIEAE